MMSVLPFCDTFTVKLFEFGDDCYKEIACAASKFLTYRPLKS